MRFLFQLCNNSSGQQTKQHTTTNNITTTPTPTIDPNDTTITTTTTPKHGINTFTTKTTNSKQQQQQQRRSLLLVWNHRKNKKNTTANTNRNKELSIQDNIVRIQTYNTVYDKYDILDIIGKGSMGYIYKVQIKSNKIGGSAFYPRMKQTSAKLLSQFFHHQNNNSSNNNTATTTTATTTTTTATINTTTSSSKEISSKSNRHVYALKTIRMDHHHHHHHNTNDNNDNDNENDDDNDMISTYIQEMMNEMILLRSMDHPNIIKIHEVFITTSTTSHNDDDMDHRSILPLQQLPNLETTTILNDTTPLPITVTTSSPTTTTATTTTPVTQNHITPSHHYDHIQQQQICLVLELCTGGDLYTRLPYTEKDAAHIIIQILHAIHYMHKQRHIVHRDLKFENILFVTDHKRNFDIKILDFGLSKQIHQKCIQSQRQRRQQSKHNHISNQLLVGYMTDQVGTIYTMSPEVLDGYYTAQTDVWSIGVISYMLLSSKKPFYHKNRYRMMEQIKLGQFCDDMETSPIWTSISKVAKDFVRRLLVVNPKDRMSIYDALHHPFMIHRKQLSGEIPSYEMYSMIESSILNYTHHTNQLKKLALTVIAHNSSNHDLEQLRHAFIKFDIERDGILSYTEFKQAFIEHMQCKNTIYTEEKLETIFNSLDINHNGMIMYTEFLAATIEACGYIEEDLVAEAFDRLDSDDSGYISIKNLREVLGDNCTNQELEAIIAAADTDHDGKISYTEFLELFRDQIVRNTTGS